MSGSTAAKSKRSGNDIWSKLIRVAVQLSHSGRPAKREAGRECDPLTVAQATERRPLHRLDSVRPAVARGVGRVVAPWYTAGRTKARPVAARRSAGARVALVPDVDVHVGLEVLPK